MSKYPWFRLYTETVDDEKLRLLAFEDRWHFVALLCCKGSGLLDSGDDDSLLRRKLAVKLGLSVREFEEVSRRLSEVGLIDFDTFQPLAWDDRQFRSDSSTDRVRKHRDRVKQSRNVSVTAQETDTDTETEEKQTNFVRSSSADDEPVASGVPPCPHQDIIAAYHEILPMLPGVREWTPARRTALAARWREKPERQTITWWRKLFSYVAESDFLTGRVSRGRGHDAWQCSLPWLLKPENFAKLLEGHYENREVSA